MSRAPHSASLTIATRESPLALWQANFIAAQLREAHPGLQVALAPMSTQGDRWLSSPLSEVGGKGLFIKELEQAMLDGRAQLAVHSMKDLPAILPAGFTLAAVGYRDDVADALVCPAGHEFMALPAGSVIGSSSLRRQALLRSQRGDVELKPVRGNLGTRLAKLDAGDYDALILASTGLARLGLGDRITHKLPLSWSTPAPGQGALGVECLAEDKSTLALLGPLNQERTATAVSAERSLSAALGASCSTPLGGYARWLDNGEANRGDKSVPSNAGASGGATEQHSLLQLTAVVATVNGQQVLRATQSGPDAQALGVAVANELLAQGAQDILQTFVD